MVKKEEEFAFRRLLIRLTGFFGVDNVLHPTNAFIVNLAAFQHYVLVGSTAAKLAELWSMQILRLKLGFIRHLMNLRDLFRRLPLALF